MPILSYRQAESEEGEALQIEPGLGPELGWGNSDAIEQLPRCPPTEDQAAVLDTETFPDAACGGTWWTDPDEDYALELHDQITQAPLADQADLVADMDEDDFRTLVDHLPQDQRREMLEPLLKVTTSPERKLEIWRRYSQAQAREHARNQLEALDPEASDADRQRVLDQLEHSAREGDQELEALMSDPNLDLKAVDALVARKELERQLEEEHGVDLTHSDELRDDGTRVIWTEDELRALDRALDANESAHGESHLRRVHRARQSPRKDNADHLDGHINLYDAGADLDRTRRGARESADPGVLASDGTHATWLEWVMLHELGHNEHDFGSDGILDDYRHAMQVRETSVDQAHDELGLIQVLRIEASEQPVIIGDRAYAHVDGKIRSFPADLYTGKKQGPFAEEYFSEHHNQAILRPEQTAVDYLDTPTAALAKAETELLALPPGPARDAKAQQVETARKEQQIWRRTYDLMRNEVFHTDQATAAASAKLRARSVPEARIAKFEREAYRLSTPDQVERLAKTY